MSEMLIILGIIILLIFAVIGDILALVEVIEKESILITSIYIGIHIIISIIMIYVGARLGG